MATTPLNCEKNIFLLGKDHGKFGFDINKYTAAHFSFMFGPSETRRPLKEKGKNLKVVALFFKY
jgi:hypothetical protein